MFRLLLLLFVLLFPPSAFAAEQQPALFADFMLNTPRTDCLAYKGALEGEGEFLGDILLPEQQWLEFAWRIRLSFKADHLVRVSLMSAYSRERMDKVTKHLRSTHHEMLGLVVDKKSLDFISQLKIAGPEGLQQHVSQLLQAGPHKRLTYAWFDTTNVSREMKIMARNLEEYLMMVSSSTREVEVTLLGDGNSGPGIMLVDFSFPILSAE